MNLKNTIMLQKGQKLYSILFNKCPRCHESNFWKVPYFFEGFRKLWVADFQMHDKCEVCGLKYELEPGFWWGAMYLAYAFSSGTLLITAGICRLGFNLDVNTTMLVVLIVSLIGFTFNARLARIVWINIYVAYDKKYAKHKSSIHEHNIEQHTIG
jgi:hypothetical protein